MSTLSGSCYCRAVQFQVTLPPRFVAHCHCHNCRAAHGAPLVTWAGFQKSEQFSLADGAPVGRYETETQATRTFCTRCGTPLFYESPKYEGEIHIARPAIDGELPAPNAHAWADRAVDWYPILDGLKQIGGETGGEPMHVSPRVDALVFFTTRLEAMVEFYRTIGLALVEEQHDDGPLHFACETGLAHFAIYEATEGDDVPRLRRGGATTFGFRVLDLDATLDRLGADAKPEDVPWGRRVLISDPDGRTVELNQAPV